MYAVRSCEARTRTQVLFILSNTLSTTCQQYQKKIDSQILRQKRKVSLVDMNKGGLAPWGHIKRVCNVFPLMYILWKSFLKKMFKKDAFKAIWEPWVLSHYWHIQNEIDSSHSNLETIIRKSGKNLRFKASLLSDWIETDLNPC